MPVEFLSDEQAAAMDAALRQLRAQGYPVLDADVARLSPFLHKHINVLGSYSSRLAKHSATTVEVIKDRALTRS